MPSGNVAKSLNEKCLVEGYPEARKNLSNIFNSFIFVTVQSLENDSVRDYFRGEAQEVGERFPRIVFFEKYSRNKSSAQFLSMSVVDSLSTPQVGDVLWGSLAPAKTENARCKFQLKGWCVSKQLCELRRMVKFGCNKTENFARTVLLQTSCEIAKMKLLQYPGDHRFQSMSRCRDDIWLAAKVVLWGNTRHLAILENKELKEPMTDNERILKESITISKSGSEIAEILAEKLGCIQILQDFWDHFVPQATLPSLPPPPPPYAYSQFPSQGAHAAQGTSQGAHAAQQSSQAYGESYAPPPYVNPYMRYNDPPPHIRVPDDPAPHKIESPYMPSSPIENKTPEYVPTSPIEIQDYVATSPI